MSLRRELERVVDEAKRLSGSPPPPQREKRLSLSPPRAMPASPLIARVGGGYAAVSPPRGDPLRALEDELRTSAETIRVLRARVTGLEAQLQRRGDVINEHTGARASLQAEVAAAQKFVNQSATEIASLRQSYEQLEAKKDAEVAEVAKALEVSRAECGRYRAALEEERAAFASRSSQLDAMERSREGESASRLAALDMERRAWAEEREALRRSAEKQMMALQEGWAGQRAMLEREVADERARSESRRQSPPRRARDRLGSSGRSVAS